MQSQLESQVKLLKPSAVSASVWLVLVLALPASAPQIFWNSDLDFLGESMRESLAVILPQDISMNMNRICL
jgi:hypothetical protein